MGHNFKTPHSRIEVLQDFFRHVHVSLSFSASQPPEFDLVSLVQKAWHKAG